MIGLVYNALKLLVLNQRERRMAKILGTLLNIEVDL